MGNVIYYIKKFVISFLIGWTTCAAAIMIKAFPEGSPLYGFLGLGVMAFLLIWGQKFLPFMRKASERKTAETVPSNSTPSQYKKYAVYIFFAACFVAGIMFAAKRHETSTVINASCA